MDASPHEMEEEIPVYNSAPVSVNESDSKLPLPLESYRKAHAHVPKKKSSPHPIFSNVSFAKEAKVLVLKLGHRSNFWLRSKEENEGQQLPLRQGKLKSCFPLLLVRASKKR